MVIESEYKTRPQVILYIPIDNPQGGGVDISLFSGEKAWGQRETFVKYRQSQG